MKSLYWLKQLYACLQSQFQYADSSAERQRVMFALVDLNKKISNILERKVAK